MKQKPLDITFHNPNSKEDSDIIARDFISRAAQSVVTKMVLEHANQHTGPSNEKRSTSS